MRRADDRADRRDRRQLCLLAHDVPPVRPRITPSRSSRNWSLVPESSSLCVFSTRTRALGCSRAEGGYRFADLFLEAEEKMVGAAEPAEFVLSREPLHDLFERRIGAIRVAIAGEKDFRLRAPGDLGDVERRYRQGDREKSLHPDLIMPGEHRDHGAEGVAAERDRHVRQLASHALDRRTRVLQLADALAVAAFASADGTKVEPQRRNPPAAQRTGRR